MSVLSIQCGYAIQNGINIAANIIPSPIEIVIKSISQAINLSIRLANTIVLVFDAVEDGDGKVYLWRQRPNESPDREATLMVVDSFQGM